MKAEAKYVRVYCCKIVAISIPKKYLLAGIFWGFLKINRRDFKKE